MLTRTMAAAENLELQDGEAHCAGTFSSGGAIGTLAADCSASVAYSEEPLSSVVSCVAVDCSRRIWKDDSACGEPCCKL